MRTEKEYKNLTIKEFTKAADVYETDHAGIYEMCKEDYPYISSELEKEDYHDLLDCGCGTGPMISLLYEKDPTKHYTAPKLILWLMNYAEMPLANLAGHGDVAARSLDEIKAFCNAAGLKIEKLERAKKFRLHLVARK